MAELETAATEPVKAPGELEKAAKNLVRALDATRSALGKYYDVAVAIGHASGNPTERGFSGRQVRQRLQAEVVARLSPRGGVLDLTGAPEARRYTQAQPLPGLA